MVERRIRNGKPNQNDVEKGKEEQPEDNDNGVCCWQRSGNGHGFMGSEITSIQSIRSRYTNKENPNRMRAGAKRDTQKERGVLSSLQVELFTNVLAPSFVRIRTTVTQSAKNRRAMK